MILDDVCNIVDKEMLEKEDIKAAIREWFETHRQQVKLPNGDMALVNVMWR